MITLITSLLAQAPRSVGIGNFDCIGAYCPTPAPNDVTTSAQPIENLLSNVFGFLTIVGGLAFLIYFVVGAISWITAGGDTGKVDKAKTIMTNALIGLIIVIAAFAISWIVGAVLGIPILNPVDTLKLLKF